jgi:formyltetrahydrofolate synthetase
MRAGFVVMICRDVTSMPSLPKEPAAMCIDTDGERRVRGPF